MEYLTAVFNIKCDTSLMQTARDLLADAAAEAGFESFEDIDNGLTGYVQKELFDKEILNKNIEDFPLEGTEISYSLQEAENKDWNEAWEKGGFDPIHITPNLDSADDGNSEPSLTIAPYSSVKDGKSGDDTYLYIDAKMAFGTGTHDTTRMIISYLLSLDMKGKHILDCGCGTGILSIAAIKLGAACAIGYDIDEWSVNNTRHNAELNGIACNDASNQSKGNIGSMQVYHGDASVLSHISGVFDIVLANINRNILLHDMPAFVGMMSKDAKIILSGFYTEDLPILQNKASEVGLKLEDSKESNNWCCAVFSLH